MAAAKKQATGTTSTNKILGDIIEQMSQEEPRYPLPKSVLVLGRQVPIKTNTNVSFKDDGEFDAKRIKIQIKGNQVPLEEMDTLLHETLHAVDHWLDLDMSERQIRLMATALIGIFQDNPDFAEFVTRPIKAIDL